jgi:hypothetical protein
VNVHHFDEAETPRTMKSPLPGVSNVKVVLQHFHRHCYKRSLLWFFVGEGLAHTRCKLLRNTVDMKIYVVRATGA